MILLSCCFIITACGADEYYKITKSDIYKECVRKNINNNYDRYHISTVKSDCVRYVRFEMKINGYVLPSDKPVDENY